MKIITQQKELNQVCQELQKGEYVTVDTEFIRERTFWAKLCLIQIANQNTQCIIDPLSKKLELDPFFEIMQNKKITKVFHAGKQDIEIIWNLTQSIPEPIFDTQIAAMVCGYGEQVSYYELVEKIVGEKIDKTSQFSDWGRRPLTEQQLNYALSDVTHLRDVYKKLKSTLKQNKREEWLVEEVGILTNPETYDNKTEDAWKRTKSNLKKPEDIAVLRALAEWREVTAKKRNKPRRHIIRDEALQEIAKQKPKKFEEIKRLRGIPNKVLDGNGWKPIVEAVKRGCEEHKKNPIVIKKQKQKMPNGNQAPLTEMMKLLLKIVAKENKVASKLIATVDEISRFVAGEESRFTEGWRNEIFGVYAKKLMKGQIMIAYINNKIEILENNQNQKKEDEDKEE